MALACVEPVVVDIAEVDEIAAVAAAAAGAGAPVEIAVEVEAEVGVTVAVAAEKGLEAGTGYRALSLAEEKTDNAVVRR